MRHRCLTTLAVGASALSLAACGNSKSSNPGPKGVGGVPAPVSGQKSGGTLKVLSNEGFEHLDPGSSYFQLDYEVVYATQRPLYSFKPEVPQRTEPDLAAAPATISKDQKTITVKIRPGVKYSPPVSREVTSADVKYAMERAFTPAVANGYAASYFTSLQGVGAAAKGKPISGIETPDAHTIVFKLTKPFAATFVNALSLPITVPVPKEYAAKFDKKAPSGYDSKPTEQAFTGPYVIKDYQPGKHLVLARNPSWDAKTAGDYRPAYVDKVDWTIGADPNVAGRQILTGQGLVSGDTPPAPIVKRAVQTAKGQISFTPLGNRYIAMNTQLPPFDNVNLRRAVVASFDRKALQLTRGGVSAGDIANHFLPPTAPGYAEAGGAQGPGFDFLKNPSGDPALAASYMKKAGYPSGKYTGKEKVVMIGDNNDPASKTAQVALEQFRKLGFDVAFRSVQHETMYSKFCNVPKAKVQVCPNVGWLPDFNDGYAYLYAPFDSKAIVPENNSNWPQLKDPTIDAAIEKASDTADPAARAKAWGQVDRLVTGAAPAVPWFWDRQPNIQSKNVQPVIAQWNAAFDLAFTSIK